MALWSPHCPTRGPRRCAPPSLGYGATNRLGRRSDRRGRGEWLGRLGDWLFDNDERIAELLQRETGKPWQEATLEVPTAIDLTEYYRKRAEEFLADSHPRPHGLLTASKKLTIAYRPYPVVGHHLSVELPHLDRPGRCGPRAVGGRGGRHQAV